MAVEPELQKLLPFTSEDIDFKGNRDDVQRIAKQLKLVPVYPHKVQMTSLAGAIPFHIGDLKSNIEVVRVIPGGPADLDKRDIRLKPGDRIIMVGEGDGPPVDIRHLPLRKIVERIRGEKGSKVVLIVVPASDLTGSTQKRVILCAMTSGWRTRLQAGSRTR